MCYLRLPALSVLVIVGITAVAAEPTNQPQITGKWKLTEFNDDPTVWTRPGKITPAVPTGVGGEFLGGGEFLVPGESPGSKRHSLPDGIHFRVSPVSITKKSAVVDILLAHTQLNTRTIIGFSASSNQTDGRYEVEYGKPFSVSLKLADTKVRYQLEIELQQE